MSYVDILAPVIDLEHDEAALVAAGELAALTGARVAALMVSVHLASAYAENERPLSELLADIAAGSHSQAAQERDRVRAWLAETKREFELREVSIERAVEDNAVVANARAADLIVMTRPQPQGRARRALIERVLFKSGRPILLTPNGAPVERTWRRIVIGWNAKAQAVRSIAAAMPLLKAAEDVAIATVDAKPSISGHGEGPGREIAAHLARHGVNVTVRNLDSLGRSDARVLLDETVAFGADMLVLGAFGHSRAQEMIFGGVTKEVLSDAQTPLFLMH